MKTTKVFEFLVDNIVVIYADILPAGWILRSVVNLSIFLIYTTW